MDHPLLIRFVKDQVSSNAPNQGVGPGMLVRIAEDQYEALVEGSGGGVSAYTYKGSVASASNLPNDTEVGDLYTVADENNAEYVWDGENWIKVSREITAKFVDYDNEMQYRYEIGSKDGYPAIKIFDN